MGDSLLLGFWRLMLPVPGAIWRRHVSGDAQLDFMSQDHHRVREFVVRELPRARAPLPPELIAQALDLDLGRVVTLLDELERHMTFLFRNEQGAVVWAYPVTAERTPHRARLSTGELAYAA